MNTIFRMAETAALIALTFALIVAARAIAQASRDEQALTAQTLGLEARATATMTDARRVVLSIGGTAAEIRKTSITTRAAAEEQRKLVRQMSEEGVKTLRDGDAAVESLNNFLVMTNANFNGKLLPQATETLKTFNLAGQSLQNNFDLLKATNEHLEQASLGLSKVVNDPDIPGTLADFHGIVRDGHETADYYKRELMKPGAVWWNVFKTLLGPAAHGAEIYSAVQ